MEVVALYYFLMNNITIFIL